ncbi:MAG: IS1634 family transposase [Desulfovibrio sp.]|jgi:transposase|nr:IS1634 family transposase [Desulfovibrio sp.]
MYLAKMKRKKGTYLAIVKAYRKDGSQSKKMIESLGYLEDLRVKYPDPIAHFEGVVREMNVVNAAENATETLTYSKNERFEEKTKPKNFGYAALSAMYHDLELDRFFFNHGRELRTQFDINSVIKMLVYARILWPGSKLAAYEDREKFFDKMDFSVDDMYRTLTYAEKYKDSVQVWIHQHIAEQYGRDTEFVYYDVTNYYFEIDAEDELRKKGLCKEHRPNPIVQMGLFMDNGGLPIAYRLFAGNNNDCTTLLPLIKSVRNTFGIGKTVVVADKGMNTARNAYYLANSRGGYIFSQKVRGGTKELQNYVLNASGYEWNKDGDFKKKSRQFTRYVEFVEEVEGENGEKTEKTIRANIAEKQLVFWSRDYDRKAKVDREKVIQKALDIVKDTSKYNKNNTYGAAKYIKNLEFDDAGEIVTLKSKPVFNYEKLADDEQYDGYYLIVSSRYNAPDQWMLDHYRGLWKIEETFKVTKSDLQARPVYVSRQNHIQAHFMICFISLVLIRLLQKKLGDQYSTTQIIESLRQIECVRMDMNRYIFGYFDEVARAIGAQTGIDFTYKYRTLLDIRKALGKTKRKGV